MSIHTQPKQAVAQAMPTRRTPISEAVLDLRAIWAFFDSDMPISDSLCSRLSAADCATAERILALPAETWADVLLKTDLMTEKRVTDLCGAVEALGASIARDIRALTGA